MISMAVYNVLKQMEGLNVKRSNVPGKEIGG